MLILKVMLSIRDFSIGFRELAVLVVEAGEDVLEDRPEALLQHVRGLEGVRERGRLAMPRGVRAELQRPVRDRARERHGVVEHLLHVINFGDNLLLRTI